MTSRQKSTSVSIYLKNIPVRIHPDPIWNDGALGFFEECCPDNIKNNKNNKTNGDMASVPGPQKLGLVVYFWAIL